MYAKDEFQIPVPVSVLVRGGSRKYPFDTMAVGESFHVPGDKDAQDRVVLAARVFRYRHRQRAGEAHQHAFQRDDKGIRCWRTA